MPTIILRFLPYIVFTLAVLGEYAFISYRGQEIKTLEAQLSASQGSVSQLTASVKDQNTAIDKLKADADARLTANAAALDTAKRTRNQANLSATKLLAMQAPVGANKCVASNDLINGEIK